MNLWSTETSTKIAKDGRKEGRGEGGERGKEIEVLLVLLEMLQKEKI